MYGTTHPLKRGTGSVRPNTLVSGDMKFVVG
jgi:hypothetical protein